MDRSWATSWNGPPGGGGEAADEFALPSRLAAIAALHTGLDSGAGPLLLTGEPGIGKTWAGRRLAAEMPTGWRWVGVDLSPANEPLEIYRAIGYALGLDALEAPGRLRLALADFLREQAADGGRWGLVIDEAQSVDPIVLEEVRILANRLGQPDGFSGLILVGQTALARRLASRPLAALSVRLAAHVHLRPIDVDETRELLDHLVPGHDWDDATLDRRHRDAAGNPRRLVAMARQEKGRDARPATPRPASLPAGAPAARAREWEGIGMVPARPPLSVEDGVIEVGWDPSNPPGRPAVIDAPTRTRPLVEPIESSDADPVAEEDVAASGPDPAPSTPVAPSEEAIDDHYAALQAWAEQARHQDRMPAPMAAVASPPHSRDGGESAAPAGPSRKPAGAEHAGVWMDGQQTAAPFGQLFSRLREANERA